MELDATDIPQANLLPKVRALIDGIHRGPPTEEALGIAADLSGRHVQYYLHAARVLGFIEFDAETPTITDSGTNLTATSPGSAEEATALIRAVTTCPVVIQVAGDLLSDDPSKEQIAGRIRVLANLSQSTADRRADTIIKWREFVRRWSVAPQLVPAAGTPSATSTRPASAPSSPGAPQQSPDSGSPSSPPALPAPAPSSPTTPETLLAPAVLANLADQVARGRLSLFTGAGFSMDAANAAGERLPSGVELANEVWKLLYPDDAYEPDSSLADLFAQATKRQPRALEALLKRRFMVESRSLPEHYAAWFSMPWRSIYTLNVDDLSEAAGRQFNLPRTLVPRSALDRVSARHPKPDEVHVVHLNGRIVDGISHVTFDVTQYARRLNDPEPAYATLAADLLAFPFIFVGTPIDEAPFWQHVELRGRRGHRDHEMRPRCFLVTPKLSRARQGLLEEYNIVWVPCTAQVFAKTVLSHMGTEAREGLEAARRSVSRETDELSNIRDVAELVAASDKGRTEFLAGAEPTWGDLLEGRAIGRSMDQELLTECKNAFAPARDPADVSDDPSATVILVTGTAGSGKSTSLMRAAAALSSEGIAVAWVARDAEVSPRNLREFWRSEGAPAVLAIDDADRYGTSLGPLLGDLARTSGRRLVLLALRASKVDRTLEAAEIPPDVPQVEFSVPLLSDDDIDGIIEALSRENRLGRLTGKPRADQVAAFREQAGRQLLVAMIQATSGRKFDEKVLEECADLPDDKRYLYTLIALATSLRYKPTKSELLLASGSSRTSGELKALTELVARHIVIQDKSSQRYGARHRVIAERLVDQLATKGEQLVKPLAGLGFAVSTQLSPQTDRQDWRFRFVKTLTNNDYLFRICSLDGARVIYDAIERNLSWDHHFWLQRGSLEVKNGDIRSAEQWLDTAMSLNSNDAYVITEYAYMLLRKAIAAPEAGEASDWVNEALSLLRAQILARGRRDAYPYHILGMQGLGWSSKSRMSKQERKIFLAGLLNDVKDGASKHPSRKELRELRDTIQRELWGLEVRTNPGGR